MHVLIASDASPMSLTAASEAAALLASADHVTLLTVLNKLPVEDYDEYDEPLPAAETQTRSWDSAIREANLALERAAASVAAAHVDQRVEAGDVAPTICTIAREIDADVIVIGAHMRGRFRRPFLTSVVERVVRDAPCAVLVAQEKAATEAT